MEDLYRQFEADGDEEISDHLLELLNAARKTRWQETTAEMNFTHSSRKAWKVFRHLGESSKPTKIKSNIDPEQIASVIVNNSRADPTNRHQNRIMRSKIDKVSAERNGVRSPV